MPVPTRLKRTQTSYITRTAALRKLQLSLKQFRKLCILKGIFPREPTKKVPKGKIYYFTKDISFLLHDPLINKIREQYTINRKIKKAKKRGELDLAEKLKKDMPKLNVEHILRERYPTFIDALRDMDDALCLLYAFSNLPVTNVNSFDGKRAANCQRKIKEWEAYVVRSNSLEKCFVSIKGIYYQAEVFGQKITWITSHKQVQYLPDKASVDLNVMLTFLEFYETMVEFVLFKLYHSLGLHYPPKLDATKDKDEDRVLDQLLQKLEPVIKKKENVGDDNMEVDNINENDKQKSKENQNQKQTKKRISTLDTSKLLSLEEKEQQKKLGLESTKGDNQDAKINEIEKEFEKDQNESAAEAPRKLVFDGLKFFLSRETPRHSLEFVIKSLGGKVYWEGGELTSHESDTTITHQVIDRTMQSHIYLSREYVQPQWIYDCANEKILLPVTDYGINAKLPPHLSPFVDDESVGYIPDRRKKLNRLREAIENGEPLLSDNDAENENKNENDNSENEGENKSDQNQAQAQNKEDNLESQFAEELKAERQGKVFDEKEAARKEQQRKINKRKVEESERVAASKLAEEEATLLLTKKQRNILERRKRFQDNYKEKISTLELKRKRGEQDNNNNDNGDDDDDDHEEKKNQTKKQKQPQPNQQKNQQNQNKKQKPQQLENKKKGK